MIQNVSQRYYFKLHLNTYAQDSYCTPCLKPLTLTIHFFSRLCPFMYWGKNVLFLVRHTLFKDVSNDLNIPLSDSGRAPGCITVPANFLYCKAFPCRMLFWIWAVGYLSALSHMLNSHLVLGDLLVILIGFGLGAHITH